MKAATLLALLLAPTLALAGIRPLTLEECVDVALGRSLDLQIAELDIKAAEETVWAARASLLPNISGLLTGQTFWGEPTSPFTLLHIVDAAENPILPPPPNLINTTRTTTSSSETIVTRRRRPGKTETTIRVGPLFTSVTNISQTVVRSAPLQRPPLSVDFPLLGFGSVSLSYPLFKDGSILGLNNAPAVESAKAQRTALVWTKDLTREQVIFIVAAAYLDAAVRAERLRLDARRVVLTEQRLPNIQEQARLGIKLQTDVQFAEEQLRSSRRMLALAREQDASARAHLAVLLDMDARTLTVSTRLPSAPVLPGMDQLLSASLGRHPGIGVESAVVEQKLNDYRLARAQMLPQVSIGTSYVHGVDFSAPADQRLYTGMLSISVPIFDFGAQRANARAAHDRFLSEKIRLAKVGEDIRSAILGTYSGLVIIEETVAAAQRDAVQADTAFQVARAQWQSGLIPPLTAIDAELLSIDKREALDDSRERELIGFATLQNATGGTWKWLQ